MYSCLGFCLAESSSAEHCRQLGRAMSSLEARLVKIHLQCGRPGFDPWIGKIPWRREWQPTPVFLPGESHGQRILAVYSPQGGKESDTTERLSTAQPSKYVQICLSLRGRRGENLMSFCLTDDSKIFSVQVRQVEDYPVDIYY